MRWYERHKRDLPWRRTRDPYAIWVSEIMLQQTRVAAVIPYYERFLKRFPRVRGSRAGVRDRASRRCGAAWDTTRARATCRRPPARSSRQAGFPRDYASIRELAGVGDYTAAAVASIAFGLPHAAIDGNVRRVVMRLAGDARADVGAIATQLLTRRDPGRWNQAVMELGATVCLPRDPLCAECPVSGECQANAPRNSTLTCRRPRRNLRSCARSGLCWSSGVRAASC